MTMGRRLVILVKVEASTERELGAAELQHRRLAIRDHFSTSLNPICQGWYNRPVIRHLPQTS